MVSARGFWGNKTERRLKIRMLAVSPFEDSAKSSTSWRPLQTSQGLALGSGRDLFQSPGQVDQTFNIVGG